MSFFSIVNGFLFLLLANTLFAQVEQPKQPLSGPGGSEYLHAEVKQYDHTAKQDGFWLYEPASPRPDSANVIVFIHGYGAHEPLVYGAWIKHLVRKGNIVIFPKYQKTLVIPTPKHYPENAATGIKDAFELLKKEGHVKPKMENIIYTGHSYGGAIAAYLGMKYALYALPKPKALMLNQPGTGGFKGAKLDDYSALEKDIKLVVFVGKDDRVVGDKLARKIFSTADVPYQNLFLHWKDEYGTPEIKSTHAAPCALDQEFDTGRRNYIIRAAMKRSRTDVVDFFGYWKVLDALVDCSFYKKNCDYCFGDTEKQQYFGTWSDGNPIQVMTIFEELED